MAYGMDLLCGASLHVAILIQYRSSSHRSGLVDFVALADAFLLNLSGGILAPSEEHH